MDTIPQQPAIRVISHHLSSPESPIARLFLVFGPGGFVDCLSKSFAKDDRKLSAVKAFCHSRLSKNILESDIKMLAKSAWCKIMSMLKISSPIKSLLV